MITASALPRLLNCSGSAVLPRSETASIWADAGQAEHEELSRFDELDPELAQYIPADAKSEVKLSFDVATGEGRFVGYGSDRSYGAPGPFEIFGSADVQGTDGDAVVIVDFKTGFVDVEPAATNAQLAFYALAACRALKMGRAIVRILYTKTNRCDEAELSSIDLADLAKRLLELHTRVAALQSAHQRGEVIPTREGSWCRYCASKPYCGSKNALLIQLAQPGATLPVTMTPELAAAGHAQIVRLEQLLNDAKKRRDQYVDDNGPIDLGGGRFYGRYVRNGNERLDGDVAVRAIHDVVSPEVANEFEAVAVERKTTKAAIERAAKQFAAKRGTVPAIVKRIRELGGASYAPDTLPLGEYAAERNEAAERPAIDADAINRFAGERLRTFNLTHGPIDVRIEPRTSRLCLVFISTDMQVQLYRVMTRDEAEAFHAFLGKRLQEIK